MAAKRVRESPRSAYEDGLRRLARRDHSEAELRQALLRKGFAAEEVQLALDRLVRNRHLDDVAFAERFARSRLASQARGRNHVRVALASRGVEPAIADQALAEALRDVSEAEMLDQLAKKYWAQRKREEPRQRLRKLWNFLLRRGYPPEIVSRRLRTLWPGLRDTIEDLDETTAGVSPT